MVMPRTARASQAGYCYHVLNRGNARAEVFHKPADYAAFLHALAEASVRLPMRLLAYCFMPNHFHLVVRPHGDGDLSRWMQWLLTTHVRRCYEAGCQAVTVNRSDKSRTNLLYVLEAPDKGMRPRGGRRHLSARVEARLQRNAVCPARRSSLVPGR
jgi:REP element-mobilizing transposase RayT